MRSLCTTVLDRGLVTLAQLEAAMVRQMLNGGDLGTNLLEVGALGERDLVRVLADLHEMPLGPEGPLPAPDDELRAALPPQLARRFGVVPVGRSEDTLHVATLQALDPDAERHLRRAAGEPLRPILVGALRWRQAMHEYCEAGLGEREQRLLDRLDAAIAHAVPASDKRHKSPAPSPSLGRPGYRRMSERPEGIIPSARQARLIGVAEVEAGAGTEPPSTPRTAAAALPSAERDTLPPRSDEEIARAESAALAALRAPHRLPAAAPAAEAPISSRRGRRGPSGSAVEEFERHVSEPPAPDLAPRAPPFRHRGPLSRKHAEHVVARATDVRTVLEVLARYGRQYFDRCALFVSVGERAELRVAHGMRIDQLHAELTSPSVLRRAFLEAAPVVDTLATVGVDRLLRDELDVGGQQRIAVVPLPLRGRVLAMLYGDDVDLDVEPAAVREVFAFVRPCAVAVARMILRRKKRKKVK